MKCNKCKYRKYTFVISLFLTFILACFVFAKNSYSSSIGVTYSNNYYSSFSDLQEAFNNGYSQAIGEILSYCQEGENLVFFIKDEEDGTYKNIEFSCNKVENKQK